MADKDAIEELKRLHTLGERVRFFRELRDLSQEELAKMVGTSQQQIEKVERNVTKHPRNLEQIAKALNVPASVLLFPPSDLSKLTAEGLQLAVTASSLSESDMRAVRSLIESLAAKK